MLRKIFSHGNTGVGRWPNLNSVDDPVTRKEWPESFVTRTTSGNWENQIGCNCRSTPGQGGSTTTFSLSTSEVETGTISSEAVSSLSAMPTEVETVESSPTTASTLPQTVEVTEFLVTTTVEAITNVQTGSVNQTPETVSTEKGTDATTTPRQIEIFPTPEEIPITTEMIPTPNAFPTLTANFSENEGWSILFINCIQN